MYLYFLGNILQCDIKALMSTVNGSLMGKLCGVEGKSEGCGTHIVKDLEALVLKTIKESGDFCRAEMVVDAVYNVVGFYEKQGFRKNGPLAEKLQPRIKKIVAEPETLLHGEFDLNFHFLTFFFLSYYVTKQGKLTEYQNTD